MKILHSFDASGSDFVGYEFLDGLAHRYLGSKPNTPDSIATIVAAAVKAEAVIALESTGDHHADLCVAAMKAKVPVVLVDGYAVKLFKKSMKTRSKSDKIDSHAIGSYVIALEAQGKLRYMEPGDCDQAELKSCLRKRHLLVKHRMACSMGGLDDRMISDMSKGVGRLDRRIKQLCKLRKKLYTRLLKVPGLGEVASAFLVSLFWDVQAFANADSAVAYCGLDVIFQESGTFKGKRKLSKRGWGLIRCILVTSAWSASRCKKDNPFKLKYRDLTARGLSKTGAACAVARMYIAVAYALAKHDQDYDSKRVGCRAQSLKKAA